MKILALDTATEACSAALNIDGEITTCYQLAPREHSRLILRMIDDLLRQAKLPVSELDAIAPCRPEHGSTQGGDRLAGGLCVSGDLIEKHHDARSQKAGLGPVSDGIGMH